MTARRYHHLVYPRVFSAKPIACGASYEETVVVRVTFPEAVISLLVEGPVYAGMSVVNVLCPICRR